MRKLLAIGAFVLGMCGYLGSPFWAAWSLREAVRRGDVAAIERKVAWTSVRESLKGSLAEQAGPSLTDGEIARGPSLWQRLKARLGRALTSQAVETYVTPEGLPRILEYSELWKRHAAGAPPEDFRPWPQRLADFLNRLKRAEFQTLTRVELELSDRDRPDRSYVGILELVGLEWKLTGLRVIPTGGTLRLR
jgi:hypothetical protein